MNSRDYLDLEMQQLINEDDTPYVSQRSRPNPFLSNHHMYGFGDGVEIEEIDDNKPSTFMEKACSYIPTAQKALRLAEMGCNFYRGSGDGCPMCCGGDGDGIMHYGGCDDCPFCHGRGSGGAFEEYTINNVPVLDIDVVDKIQDNYQKLKSFMQKRYGFSFVLSFESSPQITQIFQKYKGLSKSDKLRFLRKLDDIYNNAKMNQKQIAQEFLGKDYKEALDIYAPQYSIAKELGFSQKFIKIANIINEALKTPLLKDIAQKAIEKVTQGVSPVQEVAKALTDVVEEEIKQDVKSVQHLKPISVEQEKQKETVLSILNTIQQLAPIQEIKKITTKAQAETAKEAIKETYAQCMQRFPPGQKRKNCEHLTKAFLQKKLLQVELTKYKSYADCMADKTIKKGMRRQTCHKYTKAFRMQNPELFAQPVQKPALKQQPFNPESFEFQQQTQPKTQPKYISYAECMADKSIQPGLRRKTCHPFAKSAIAQKTSTMKRNLKIRKVAKQLKDKYPNMTYVDRMKKARKMV